jgi:hypothetical protein
MHARTRIRHRALSASPRSAGCGEASAPPTAKPVARVLLVGMDGLEWSVVRPLLKAGRMPNLLALMQRGSYGYLASMKPTLSPVVWTTIATGKLMEEHGITDFLDRRSKQVFTSGRRATRAVWNIADQYGSVHRPLRLVHHVAGRARARDGRVGQQRGQPAGRQLEAGAAAGRVRAGVARGADRRSAGPGCAGGVDGEGAEAGQREDLPGRAAGADGPAAEEGVPADLWSLLSDETYFEVACKYIKEHPADLNLVYFGGTDVVGHRYWRESHPKGYAWHDGEVLDKELAEVVPNYYAWMDEMLGALVAAAGPDTTVFVVSDHGMHAVAQEKEDTDFGMTGHHLDAPAGVIVAAGPAILRQGGVKAFLENGALPTHGSVVDVTPTLLALLGHPRGQGHARPRRADPAGAGPGARQRQAAARGQPRRGLPRACRGRSAAARCRPTSSEHFGSSATCSSRRTRDVRDRAAARAAPSPAPPAPATDPH